MFASVGDDKKLMMWIEFTADSGLNADFASFSWDTRSDNYNKASQEVEGHSLEINSVAWNRAVGTLLLTGSSDNVSLRQHGSSKHITDDVLYRPSACGIRVDWIRRCTRLKRTRTKFSSLLGHRTIRQYSRRLPRIDECISGMSPRSGRNRRQMTPKTVPRN